MLKSLIVSSRPRQWYKNVLLFVGVVFSANILNASMWAMAMLAFVYFCMFSASEYLINDIIDRQRDKAHPIKSRRPIASGRLKVGHALLVALLLIAISLVGAYFTLPIEFFIISASYLVLVALYSFALKHLVIADIMLIAVGFVIRAAAGALAVEVTVSSWLIVCTFLLALFLAIQKRRGELVALAGEAEMHRPNLAEYSIRLLEQMGTIITAALIVSYLLYTASVENEAMLITAPFAIYGLFRYLYLTHQKGMSPEPEVIFRDRSMLVNLAIWAVIVVAVMLTEEQG
ncbi:MAG: decaprenyl-phosphate phosphoribosyltransferase [Chloroflexi bacterium]|nr:MAG: decaprenyl-phosphate phosphoribosyltransferase [Chloroflexota bacterium]